MIWGDQLLMILAVPVLKDNPGATLIADVKASQTFFDRVTELSGKPLMWKTGHSLIKSKMKETGAPLGRNERAHLFQAPWYGFDDARYAAVRLIEAVSASGKTLTEIMDAMPKTTATPELRFQVDEVRKFAIVEEVRDRLSENGARVDATDGVRVSTDDGWWLLARRTRRTSSSPAPKRRISQASIASSGRSTSSSPLQASSAWKPRTSRPRLRSRRGSARRP